MSNKDYIEWYSHNLSEEKFDSVDDCQADLLSLSKNELEENDSIYGNRVYNIDYRFKGWETTFWVHAKTNMFGVLKYT